MPAQCQLLGRLLGSQGLERDTGCLTQRGVWWLCVLWEVSVPREEPQRVLWPCHLSCPSWGRAPRLICSRGEGCPCCGAAHGVCVSWCKKHSPVPCFSLTAAVQAATPGQLLCTGFAVPCPPARTPEHRAQGHWGGWVPPSSLASHCSPPHFSSQRDLPMLPLSSNGYSPAAEQNQASWWLPSLQGHRASRGRGLVASHGLSRGRMS